MAIKLHRMTNDAQHVWWDVRVGRFWYVLIWWKRRKPFCYRSTDATPPAEDNEGKWLFGRYTGARS